MLQYLKIASINIFLAVLASSANAEPPLPLTSGRWEVTTMPEFTGIPASPTAKHDGFCLDATAIRAGVIPVRIAVGCKITGGKWEGEKLHLNVACEDAPPGAVIPAELTVAEGKSFTGFVALNQTITYRYRGTWISAECK